MGGPKIHESNPDSRRRAALEAAADAGGSGQVAGGPPTGASAALAALSAQHDGARSRDLVEWCRTAAPSDDPAVQNHPLFGKVKATFDSPFTSTMDMERRGNSEQQPEEEGKRAPTREAIDLARTNQVPAGLVREAAFKDLLAAGRNALESGLLACNCGNTCAGTCTHAMMVAAVLKATDLATE